MRRVNVVVLLCAFAIVASSRADATLITTEAALGTSTIVDFSQFGPGFTFTDGPVQIGGLVGEDIQWSSTLDYSVIGNGGYYLAENGT